jgi:hypothetical protein
VVIGNVTGTENNQHNELDRLLWRGDLQVACKYVLTIGKSARRETPGIDVRTYDSKQALPAPSKKVARTTLAGSRRLSIEAIVQRTSNEGAMAADPTSEEKDSKMSLVRKFHRRVFCDRDVRMLDYSLASTLLRSRIVTVWAEKVALK